MDEQLPLFLYTAGIIVSVYGAVLVWLIRRLLKLEDEQAKENAEINTSIAVLNTSHEELKNEVRRTDKRNEIAHDKIEKKLDDHNGRVMKRMDSLLTLVRNGGA